jgi:uncharacterized iron-regulated membrane protein
MTHPRLFHVTAAWPESSMEEFLRRRAVSQHSGKFAAALFTSRAAAGHHANRGTVAKKVGRLTAAKKNVTSAETYGEPQTPADPR